MQPTIDQRTWIVCIKDITGKTIDRAVFGYGEHDDPCYGGVGPDGPRATAYSYARLMLTQGWVDVAGERHSISWAWVFPRDCPERGEALYADAETWA